MKLFVFTLLFLMATASPVFAQKSLAVMDLKAIGTDQSLAEAVSENLRTMLIHAGAFSVVERKQLEGVLSEYSLSQSGITDHQRAIEIGGLAEAALIMTGSINKMFSSYTINARLLDVKSGVCVLAQKVEIGSEAEFPRKIDELAAFFSSKSVPEANPLAPADIIGTYRVKGASYIGKLRIEKNREVYNTSWLIDNTETKEADQTFTGVGILHNNMLSVNYVEKDDPTNVGVAIYEILLNGERLRGLYSSVANARETGVLRFENGEKITE